MIIEIVTRVKYEVDDDVYKTLNLDRGIKETVLEVRSKLIGSERMVVQDGLITECNLVGEKELNELGA